MSSERSDKTKRVPVKRPPRTNAAAKAPPRAERVNSLIRGLDVLLAFGRQAEPMTITDMAQATRLPPASARRMLLTLGELGYVERLGKRFRVGPKVLDLGYAYLSSMPLWQIVQPVTEQISEAFSVSSCAAVLDGTDIVLAVRANNRQSTSILVSTGTRQPAHVTAIGRVLLAHLAPEQLERTIEKITFTALTPRSVKDARHLRRILVDVRRRGYALVDGEMEFGLRAIAVPLVNRRGEVVAAINAAGHQHLLDLATLENQILPTMIEAARRIQAHLGH